MRSKLDILLNILEILRNKTIRKIKSTTETNETIRQYIYIYIARQRTIGSIIDESKLVIKRKILVVVGILILFISRSSFLSAGDSLVVRETTEKMTSSIKI